MRGDFTQSLILPLAQVEVVIGPLTLRQALQSRHLAGTTERPPYLASDEWAGLNDLAMRVRQFGRQPGITVEELLDLADVDTSAMMKVVGEVATREAAFRVPSAPADAGDGTGGEGDGLAARDPAVDGRG